MAAMGCVCTRQLLGAMVLLMNSPLVNAFAPTQYRGGVQSRNSNMNELNMSSGDGSEDEWVKGWWCCHLEVHLIHLLLCSISQLQMHLPLQHFLKQEAAAAQENSKKT